MMIWEFRLGEVSMTYLQVENICYPKQFFTNYGRKKRNVGDEKNDQRPFCDTLLYFVIKNLDMSASD